MSKKIQWICQYLTLSFLLVFPVSCFACPGCSMLNVFRISFLHEEDIKWAFVIVFSVVAIPLILYFSGFRLRKLEEVSIIRKLIFTIILFGGWLFIICSGPFSPNFGIFLMHWFYLPLVFQYNVIMMFSFLFPLFFFFSILLVPCLYCYFLSGFLLQYKIEKKSNMTSQNEKI